MSTNLNDLRDVSTDELRAVEGGWSEVLRILRQVFMPDFTPSDYEQFTSSLTPKDKA
jgi:hypothetical protein